MSSTPLPVGIESQQVVAYVVAKPTTARLVVGGITLLDRWRAAIMSVGVGPVYPVAALPTGTDMAPPGLGKLAAPVLVADGSAAVEQASIDVLREAATDGSDAVILSGPGMEETPLVLLGPSAARAVVERSPAEFDELLRAVQELASAGEVNLRRIEPPSPFWMRVHDEVSAKRATWEMLKRLRLRPGGLVAQHINRQVSIRITRLVLPFPISSNHVTTIAGVLGLVATAAMFQGGWLWAAVGAALMELSSILDGCDGEIARLKYQTSDFGSWYDSIWDEFVNAFFLVAVGHNLARAWNTSVFLVMGGFTGAVSLLYAGVHWHSKYKHGIGLYWWFDQDTPKKEIWESRSLISILKKLFWRDSFLFIYFLAALMWYPLPIVMCISFAGGVTVLGMLFYHIVVCRARW